jgi:hypothetical protein
LADIDKNHVTFRVSGPIGFNERAVASVFSRKLSLLVKAIEAADKSGNGGRRFEFVISSLSTASPAQAVLAEQRVGRNYPEQSSFHVFGQCVSAIREGNIALAQRHLQCTTYLAALAKDAGENDFPGAEIIVDGYAPTTVDNVFFLRAKDVLDSVAEQKASWFRGDAIGTFDGEILEVDLRAPAPKLILRLTSGGKEIDCVCRGIDVEDIRKVLDRRVEVTGKAYYDGKSGLPKRIEITKVPTLIKPNPDFRRWKGAFRGIEVKDWSADA